MYVLSTQHIYIATYNTLKGNNTVYLQICEGYGFIGQLILTHKIFILETSLAKLWPAWGLHQNTHEQLHLTTCKGCWQVSSLPVAFAEIENGCHFIEADYTFHFILYGHSSELWCILHVNFVKGIFLVFFIALRRIDLMKH